MPTLFKPVATLRTFHLLLGAFSGYLLALLAISLSLLSIGALQPSARQLAAPLISIVQLTDALDALDPAHANRLLVQRGIERGQMPPAAVPSVHAPFFEALAAILQTELRRDVVVEQRGEREMRLWVQSARGDWLSLPIAPLRSLFAGFALLILLSALALGFLAAWGLARRIAGPIERLARVAERLPEPVSPGEFCVHGTREVSLLGARLSEALERIAQQRRERDLLLAGLSHDLRTPLMRLLLRIDLLEQISEPESAQLSAEIHELDLRIDRFIEHARTGAEEPKVRLDLAKLVQHCISASTERGYTWQYAGTPPVWMRGQAAVLARLVGNLLDNAEQHGAPPYLAKLAVTDQTNHANVNWVLSVRNAQPAKRPELGSRHRGFGLALCQNIAEAHHGSLQYQATAEHFTVTLTLPAEA